MGLSVLPNLDVCFLSQIRKLFRNYVFKYVLCPFLSLFFWDLYNVNASILDIIPEVSEAVLMLLMLFSFSLLILSDF